MKQAFYISFAVANSEPNSETSWCWSPAVDADSTWGTASQLKQAVAGLAESTSIILLLPSENIFLNSIDLPAKQASQIRQAAPYAIEEQLACDPNKLHIVTRGNNQTGKVDIVGVDREFLNSCIEELKTITITPQQAYADVFKLSVAKPGTLLLSRQSTDDRILLRWRTHQGAAMPASLLTDWLRLFLQEQTEPAITQLLIDSGEQSQALTESVLGDIPGIQIEHCDLSSRTDPADGINLLTGDFRPASTAAGKQNWYQPLFMAAAAVALFIITAYLGLYRDTAQLEKLAAAIENTFREAFPSVQRIEDPMIQARQQLILLGHAGNASGNFLVRLNEFASALKQQTTVQVNSLDYRDNKLEIKIHAANIGDLEALAERIRQQGGEATLSSASLGENGVDARLLLTGPGS